MVGIRLHNGNREDEEAGSEHRDTRRVTRTTKLVSQSQYHQNASYLSQSEYRHGSQSASYVSQSQYHQGSQSVNYVSQLEHRKSSRQQCQFSRSLLDDVGSLSDGLVVGSRVSESSDYYRSALLPDDLGAFYPGSLLSNRLFDGSYTSSQESLLLHLERGNSPGPPSVVVSDADEGYEGKLEMS
ncbi:hypothetical protein Pmani_037066 [Petrolisthes manimaculis]|uniref:Uncharacterized protein n=1 Tax=Petrolisthes manimaculis TaxID=1843537 RepID=A0AAE1NH24_9EUCA|nr:hypothetical protein Pmani_037066 [Petrolisthes manimaculis]